MDLIERIEIQRINKESKTKIGIDDKLNYDVIRDRIISFVNLNKYIEENINCSKVKKEINKMARDLEKWIIDIN